MHMTVDRFVSISLTLIIMLGGWVFRANEKRLDKAIAKIEMMSQSIHNLRTEQAVSRQNREYLERNFNDVKVLLVELRGEFQDMRKAYYQQKGGR